MENNNPSGVSQWSVFSSHHCRMWFGLVKEFDCAGVCKDAFRVMHSFKPRSSGQSSAVEIEHSNVYYYDDERGTVTSSPRCGPWFYKEEDSTSIGFKGVKHPKWPNTKYIFFPSGSGIMFNNSAVNYGSVETCIKLFLLHPTRPNIRLSIMVEYCEHNLQRFKIYLENSDGWKSEFWEHQENHCESELISPSSATLISRQTIDDNLESTISTEINTQDTKLPSSEFKNSNVFSFDSESAGTLFDHILPGYASFHPTRHIAITCPISIKPSFPSSPIDATSPISLSSPVDAISMTSFVGVRWDQSPDTSTTDFIAQFDADSRFSSLTEINYKHSFAKEL